MDLSQDGNNLQYNWGQSFAAQAGFDVSADIDRGNAILFAWDAGHAPNKPIHQFEPKRFNRNTLLRLWIPMGKAAARKP
jgi:hypothetical protein